MAEIFQAELREAMRRRSGGDLEALLHALDADGAITVVDDPAPVTETVQNSETGEEEEVETVYAAGSTLAIKVDADEKAAEEAAAADDSADAAGDEFDATQSAVDLAAANGVDLSQVEGTGDGGRILKSDVEAYIAETSA